MNDEILIKLLRIQFEQDEKVEEFSDKISFDYFYVEILDVVLDALGVPPDNTVEQSEIYGEFEYTRHPDTFCRDWFWNTFREIQNGTDEEIKYYLEAVRDALCEIRERKR